MTILGPVFATCAAILGGLLLRAAVREWKCWPAPNGKPSKFGRVPPR